MLSDSRSILGSFRDNPAAQAWAFLAACLAIISLHIVWYGPSTATNLRWDGEHRTYAYFSGILLGVGGYLTILHGALFAERTRRALFVFGVFLAFLGVDEMVSLHERMEDTGYDWQIVYAPIFAAGAVGGFMVLRSVPRRSQAVLVVAGLCWVISQLLELLQWDGDVLAHPALQMYEEVLEALGSTLYSVAILAAGAGTIRLTARRGADGAATPLGVGEI